MNPKPPADDQIDELISQTAGDLWWSELIRRGVITWVSFAAATFLWVLFDHYIGVAGTWSRLFVAASAVAGGGVLLWRLLWPMRRSIDPVYAARAIERDQPHLRGSLSSYVELRDRFDHAGLSSRVIRAAGREAAKKVNLDQRPSEVSGTLSYWITAIVVLLVVLLYAILSTKSTAASLARVIFPAADIAAPRRVQITEVDPGDSDVNPGRTIDVSATITGLRRDENAIWELADGGDIVQTDSMQTNPKALDQYVGQIPIPARRQDSLTYRIIAGDAQSRSYSLRVADLPVVDITTIHVSPPSYTGIQPYQTRSAAISAPDGSVVTINARVNRKLDRAVLQFNPATTGQTTRGTAGELSMDIAQPTAGDPRDSVLTATFTLRGQSRRTTSAATESYRITVRGVDGSENESPIIYPITIIEDLAPEITITTPTSDPARVPIDAVQVIRVHATDPDYGLAKITLDLESRVANYDTIEMFSATKADPTSNGRRGLTVAEYRLRPRKLGLRVGDEIIATVTAIDNRQFGLKTSDLSKPVGGATAADPIRIIIEPARGEEPDQDEPNQDGEQTENQSPENQQGAENQQGSEDQQSSEDQQASGDQQGGQSESGGSSSDGSGGSGGGSGSDENKDKEQAGQSQEGQNQGQSGGGGDSASEQNGEPSKANDAGQSGDPADQTNDAGQPDNSEGSSSNSPSGGEENQPGSNPPSDQPDASDPSGSSGGSGESRDAASQPDAGQPNASQPGDSPGTGENSGSGDPANPGTSGDPNNKPAEGPPSHDGEAFERIRDHINENQSSSDSSPSPNGPSPDSPSPDSKDDPGGSDGSNDANDNAVENAGNKPGDETGGGNDAQNDASSTPDSSSDPSSDSSRGNDPAPGDADPDSGSNDSSSSQSPDDSSSPKEPSSEKPSSETDAQPDDSQTRGEQAKPGGKASPNNDPGSDSPADPDSQGSPGSTPPTGESTQPPTPKTGDESSSSPSGKPSTAGDQAGQADQPADPSQNPIDDSETPPDQIDQDYANEATDMVLDYLEKNADQPDPELLDKLDWTPQQLDQFRDRWQSAKDIDAADGPQARQELDDALESLGLRRPGTDRSTQREQADQFRGLNDGGVRRPPPAAHRDAFDRFRRSLSK